MSLRLKIGLIIVFVLPAWIFIRGQLIYREGPKIVKIIEEYKVKNKHYPATLQNAGVTSIFNPWYYYDKEKDGFSLMYSIFLFARWNYDSRDKIWCTLD